MRADDEPAPSSRSAAEAITARIGALEEAVGYPPNPAIDSEGAGLVGVMTVLLARVTALEAAVAALAAAPDGRRNRVVQIAKVIVWVLTTSAAIVGLLGALRVLP